LIRTHRATEPVHAQQVDRAAVVRQFLAARNAGDLEGALAMFTDDAVFTATVRPGACGAATPCVGTAALRSTFQRQISGHNASVITSITVTGSIVTGRFEGSSDGIRAAGVDRVAEVFLAEVPNDKISQWVAAEDFSDPQTAAFLAQASQPAATPTPSP
jgi:hypothetical protein